MTEIVPVRTVTSGEHPKLKNNKFEYLYYAVYVYMMDNFLHQQMISPLQVNYDS